MGISELMAKYQLETAREMQSKVNDPAVMEMVYKNLPTKNMMGADRARFATEYADIKKRIKTSGMTQANRAAGENLDSLVSRGVISSEFANKQKLKNQAATNAVIKIYNQKIDAEKRRVSRAQFMQDQATGLNAAGVAAEIDATNQAIYNNTISSALSNISAKETAEAQRHGAAANAQLQMTMARRSANTEFGWNMADAASGVIGGLGGVDGVVDSIGSLFGGGGSVAAGGGITSGAGSLASGVGAPVSGSAITAASGGGVGAVAGGGGMMGAGGGTLAPAGTAAGMSGLGLAASLAPFAAMGGFIGYKALQQNKGPDEGVNPLDYLKAAERGDKYYTNPETGQVFTITPESVKKVKESAFMTHGSGGIDFAGAKKNAMAH